jgi:hypothetical protein
MRSSTFSSRDARFHIKALLIVCAVILAGLELSTRVMARHSGTDRRVRRQYVEALSSRPSTSGEPASVLIVGNSLLLDGIDVAELQRRTSTSVKLYPLFLEGTGYYDWLHGLRALFRKGARPDVVLVGLGLDGVLDTAVRQEYAPRMLFDARDVVAASRDARLDRTVTSSLLLAHWSAFWDMRHVLRVQLLTHTLPYFERMYLSDLWSHLRAKKQLAFTEEAEGRAVARLRQLRELGERYDSRVLILIPPTPTSADSVRHLTSVAEKAGVETLMPVDPALLPAQFIRADEIHVNEQGTAFFTAALAAHLPERVVRRERAAAANADAVSRASNLR